MKNSEEFISLQKKPQDSYPDTDYRFYLEEIVLFFVRDLKEFVIIMFFFFFFHENVVTVS